MSRGGPISFCWDGGITINLQLFKPIMPIPPLFLLMTTLARDEDRTFHYFMLQLLHILNING